MLLVQNDIIDLFLANFQLDISELTRETFFLVSVFVEVGNSGLEPVTRERKRQFCKILGRIFETL